MRLRSTLAVAVVAITALVVTACAPQGRAETVGSTSLGGPTRVRPRAPHLQRAVVARDHHASAPPTTAVRRHAPHPSGRTEPHRSAPPPRRSHPRPPVGPWAPQVVDPGDYDALVGSAGGLYATVSGGTGAVVRLDPATGRIVARSAPIGDPGNPAATPGAIWVEGLAAKGGGGPAYLYRLDPTTLGVTARVRLAGPLDQYGVAGAAGRLWVQSNCTLQALDLRHPGRRALDTAPLGAGCAAGTGVVAVRGSTLVVAFASARTGRVSLQTRNAITGRLLHAVAVPAAGSGGIGFGATSDEIWATSGAGGNPGTLFWWSSPDLTLLGASGRGGDGPPIGGAGRRLPNFGDDPQVDISSGTVWVAGPAALACLDPDNGQVLASVDSFGPGPTVGGPVVVTPQGTWTVALDLGDGAPYGIARVHPPAACAG